MCKKSGESIEHLLLHCEVAHNLWSYILTIFGVEWVMPRRVLELLTSWSTSFGCDPAKEVWWLIPLYLMWYLWRKRNARHFEDVETSMLELQKRLLNMLYIWVAVYRRLSVFTYADFLKGKLQFSPPNY
jgi:hypothetical protein